MKISFVLDTFGGGGKERRCLQLIQGLNKNGYHDIQVIIINDDVAYLELYETKSEITIIDRKNRGLSFFQTCREVRALFKTFKPEIVQTWGGISTLIPIILKPLFRYKLIGAYVADADCPKLLSLDSIYPFFCDRVVGNSMVGLDAYRIPKKKAVLIYNGLNERRLDCKIDKERKKDSLNIHTSYVIAMLATFSSNKDWNCFLKAAKNIIGTRKDVTFLCVGNGPTWANSNKMLCDDDRKHIFMLGRRNDVDEILQVCDLTVLTSNHGEGISNSILESMAFGVPVIATNYGGTPEIIEDETNGILLQKNDAAMLVSKIIYLIDNPIKRLTMGEKAVNTVKKKFLLEKMIQKYIKLYTNG